jgi:hypothetical protein
MIIGYAFVMLLLATLSGAVVEVIQTICRSRTFALEAGVSRLLQELGMSSQTAPKTAKAITAHHIPLDRGGSADAIPREEFVLLLLQHAASDPGLATALEPFKLGDLGPLRLNIEKEILKQEAADPQAPAYVSRVKAMEAAGAGALAGRVFAWYDSLTRRVDDTVAFQGRVLGVVAAFLVCFWLVPVDSLDLLKRLQQDDLFRQALVERAMEEVKKAPPDPTAKAPGQADSERERRQVWETVDRVIAKADETRELVPVKESVPPIGKAVTWVMVSLGSAFWLALLRRFVGLRSSVAEMVKSQRTHREADQRKAV